MHYIIPCIKEGFIFKARETIAHCTHFTFKSLPEIVHSPDLSVAVAFCSFWKFTFNSIFLSVKLIQATRRITLSKLDSSALVIYSRAEKE